MIGVGVGVGFGGGSGRLSPTWLHSQLSTLLGADLIGLWVGEDLVVSGSDVTSWPGRVGPTLNPLVAGVYRTRTTVGGRVGSSAAADNYRGLHNTGITCKSVVAVSVVPAQPFGDIYGLAACSTDNHVMSCDLGTSNFLVYGAGGWTQHYINNVDTHSLAGLAGTLAITQTDNAANAAAGIRIGSTAIGNPAGRNWEPAITFTMALSAVPSAGNRAAATALLKRYYRL